MPDIYIVFVQVDRKRVEKLVRVFEEQGWTVGWNDIIRPGVDYRSVVEERFATARQVIFVWSTAADQSQHMLYAYGLVQKTRDEVVISIDGTLPRTSYPGMPKPFILTRLAKDHDREDFSALITQLTTRLNIPGTGSSIQREAEKSDEFLDVQSGRAPEIAELTATLPALNPVQMIARQLAHEFGTRKGVGAVAVKAAKDTTEQHKPVLAPASAPNHASDVASRFGNPGEGNFADTPALPPDTPKPQTAKARGSLIPLAVLAMAGAAVAYFFGDKIIAWLAALAGANASATPPGMTADNCQPMAKNRVDCSVFAPRCIAPAKYARVQVFLHSWDTFKAAETKALKIDQLATMQDSKTLSLEIGTGAKVDVEVRADSEELAIRRPERSTIWNGAPTSVDFFVRPPADANSRQYLVDVLLFVDGQPVGELGFVLECQEVASIASPAPERGIELRSDRATRYEKIFLSYSSRDRQKVSLVAQGYDAVDQEFFMDILSLSAGERWERKLYEKIDECDLFMLFWSENARQSEWVRKEVDYALKKEEENGKPRFVPFPLEGPPPPDPWENLAKRHIGAPIYYRLRRHETTES